MNEDSRKNSVVGSALKGIGAITTLAGTGYGIDKAMMSDAATKIVKNKESSLRGLVGSYRMNRRDIMNDIKNYKKEKEITKNISSNVTNNSKLRSKNVARNAGNVTVKRAKSGALSKAAKVINKIK